VNSYVSSDSGSPLSSPWPSLLLANPILKPSNRSFSARSSSSSLSLRYALISQSSSSPPSSESSNHSGLYENLRKPKVSGRETSKADMRSPNLFLTSQCFYRPRVAHPSPFERHLLPPPSLTAESVSTLRRSLALQASDLNRVYVADKISQLMSAHREKRMH
jgi:hypothetical protein